MTINGMELAFDMFDADTCERFEQAVEQVSQKAQALQKAQGLKAFVHSAPRFLIASIRFLVRAQIGHCLEARRIYRRA